MTLELVPTLAVALALGASLYAIPALLVGTGSAGRMRRPARARGEPVRKGRGEAKRKAPIAGAALQGRVAVLLAAAALTFAAVVLLVALGCSDFRFAYVVEHTNRSLPLAYKLSAFWAGQEGSILLWALVLGWYEVWVATRLWGRAPRLAGPALAVMSGVNAFFLVLLLARCNPFRLVATVPADGNGLNPLLQNFGMLAHPLALYLGYVGFAVPFAFAVAESLGAASNRPQRGSAPQEPELWLELTRSFTVFSWLFLSVGIILGMQWAYVELGWGGYWSWDPVENASLIPWLVATAFLHLALVQERKGTMGSLNVLLVTLTFLLTILGTFLTRTGVVSSVHAFAPSGLEAFFLPFMAAVAVLSAYTFAVARLRDRRHRQEPPESLLSRESTAVLAVLLFSALAAVVLWGTLFPLVSTLGGGRQVAVDASYYIRTAVPVGAALVLLLGLCQAVGWGRTRPRTAARRLVPPVLAAVAGVVVAAYAIRPGTLFPSGAAGLGAAFAAAASGLAALIRDVRARRSASREGTVQALARLVAALPRRYGALIVHLGVACMVAGFAGAAYRQEQTFTLAPGQTATAAGYELTFRGLGVDHSDYMVAVTAELDLTRTGRAAGRVFVLKPQKQYYTNYQEPFSEVAVLGGLGSDLYAVLDAWSMDGSASIRILREPLVAWIWIGGYLLVAGTLVLSRPPARRRGDPPGLRDTAGSEPA